MDLPSLLLNSFPFLLLLLSADQFQRDSALAKNNHYRYCRGSETPIQGWGTGGKSLSVDTRALSGHRRMPGSLPPASRVGCWGIKLAGPASWPVVLPLMQRWPLLSTSIIPNSPPQPAVFGCALDPRRAVLLPSSFFLFQPSLSLGLEEDCVAGLQRMLARRRRRRESKCARSLALAHPTARVGEGRRKLASGKCRALATFPLYHLSAAEAPSVAHGWGLFAACRRRKKKEGSEGKEGRKRGELVVADRSGQGQDGLSFFSLFFFLLLPWMKARRRTRSREERGSFSLSLFLFHFHFFNIYCY